jgi:hypothetical protein
VSACIDVTSGVQKHHGEIAFGIVSVVEPYSIAVDLSELNLNYQLTTWLGTARRLGTGNLVS